MAVVDHAQQQAALHVPLELVAGCNSSMSAVPAESNCDPCATTQNCDSSEEVSACSNYPVFVENTVAFNMPACDATGDIKVIDALRFAVGSIIFAPGVGYLVVTAVPDNETLTVRNDCSLCNTLGPGEFVASGTHFVVGIPVCGDPSGNTGVTTVPFLACDFVIPANGTCANAKVTTVVGLFVGDLVSINGYQYRISAIPDAETITLCNDGLGGTENDCIKADGNNDGILDHPVIRIGVQNACEIVPTQTADVILGCDDGVPSSLAGVVDDQVPAWSETNEQWELKVIQDLAICVSIVGCLQIDSAAPATQTYLVDVSPNTDQLQEEFDKLTDGGYLAIEINGDPFAITEIVDSDTIRVLPTPAQPGDPKYDEGSVLCVAECCAQCRPTMLGLDDFNAGGGNPELILIGSGVAEFADIPIGVSTQTFPASIGAGDLEGDEVGAESLWELQLLNDGLCRKYVEIFSNFEFATDLVANVDVNVEFRALKTAPIADSQAFASNLFEGGRGTIVALTHDLIPAFQTLNTWKNMIAERDIVEIGETAIFKGHIRCVFNNTSGAPIVALGGGKQYVYQWRVWIKAMDFDYANVTTIP